MQGLRGFPRILHGYPGDLYGSCMPYGSVRQTRQEITIARQKEYMAGLKDDIESDKKEKEEACRILQMLASGIFGTLIWSVVEHSFYLHH